MNTRSRSRSRLIKQRLRQLSPSQKLKLMKALKQRANLINRRPSGGIVSLKVPPQGEEIIVKPLSSPRKSLNRVGRKKRSKRAKSPKAVVVVIPKKAGRKRKSPKKAGNKKSAKKSSKKSKSRDGKTK